MTKSQWRQRDPEKVAAYRARQADKLRWSKYGLTPDDFKLLLAAQGGLCGICRVDDGRYLTIDRDNRGGHIRGLLCNSCRLAVACLRSDVERMEAAIVYLER